MTGGLIRCTTVPDGLTRAFAEPRRVQCAAVGQAAV